MLVFSGSKINLGLAITSKRSDGFHDLETVFYPLNWQDALEVIENTDNQSIKIELSGLPVKGDIADNIIFKAYELIKKDHTLPGIKVHLHKNIPMGAGLGGGSANAVNFIHLMEKKFQLNMSHSKKIEYAKQLGSDCAFFVDNTPKFATGKGDILESIQVDLSKYFILVVYPSIHSDTKLAYSGITPKKPANSIRKIIEEKPIEQWKDLLVNDFETTVFTKLPQLNNLKQELYKKGAVYASMSGSGSAVYGIFQSKPDISLGNYSFFLQEPIYSKV